MCDFNKLDDAARETYHEQLISYADAFGGKNFFLQFLEAIRNTKPHPLSAKNSMFRAPRGTVKWNKVLFNDKITLLQKARIGESERGNLLPPLDDKNYKNILNLIRTLSPVAFEIKPSGSEEAEGFILHPFVSIDATTTRLDPVFDAIFFCALDTVKKVLNYQPKS